MSLESSIELVVSAAVRSSLDRELSARLAGDGLTLTAALAGIGWAQDPSLPNPIAVETRLTLLESRLARVEADVSRLSGVPLSLARIEERLENLTEKANNWGGSVSTVIIAVLTMVMDSVTGAAWQAERGNK